MLLSTLVSWSIILQIDRRSAALVIHYSPHKKQKAATVHIAADAAVDDGSEEVDEEIRNARTKSWRNIADELDVK